jgi:peptidyl-prolyl cis-trans isomerase B (cyclophilin B)
MKPGFLFLFGSTLALYLVSTLFVPVLADTNRAHRIAYAKKEKMTTEPTAVMETSKGTIKVQLFTNDAPITAGNFLDLVKRGFYNGLVFHRYEPGFCIQGGDPTGTGSGGFIDPQTKSERCIPLEVKANLKHDSAGVLAMARANDPNSASSQFYFTLAPASFLDRNYAVFGKVIEGLDVVMQLRKGDRMVKVTAQEPAVR